MFDTVTLVITLILLTYQYLEAVIYTYEDVELRRIFPDQFPQDSLRRMDENDTFPLSLVQLGRQSELISYFKRPKLKKNSHFEELVCYEQGENKVCKFDRDRFSSSEASFYNKELAESYEYMDRRRLYCFMLLCFTVDELDRVVASF